MNPSTLKTHMMGHTAQSQSTTSANDLRPIEDDEAIPLNTLAMNIFAQENSSHLWTLADKKLKGGNIPNQDRANIFNTVLRDEWDKLSQGKQLGYINRAKAVKVTCPRSSLLEEYVLRIRCIMIADQRLKPSYELDAQEV
jgi:hypothetical protein